MASVVLTRFDLFDPEIARAILLSLVPGLFWLVYLRSLSRRHGIAVWLWMWALALGAVSTQLTLLLSEQLQVDRLMELPIMPLLVYFLLGVGLVEEASKAICAFLGLGAPGLARDPLVTLQLSGAVALGFATTENVLYVRNLGESVLIGRFVFSTLGHVLFSSLWGVALGIREGVEGRARRRWGWLFGQLVLASFAHGLYDWFLVTDRMALATLTLAVLWFGFRQAALEAFLRQEYERELPYESVECPSCTVLTRAEGAYCSFCGSSMVTTPKSENIALSRA